MHLPRPLPYDGQADDDALDYNASREAAVEKLGLALAGALRELTAGTRALDALLDLHDVEYAETAAGSDLAVHLAAAGVALRAASALHLGAAGPAPTH